MSQAVFTLIVLVVMAVFFILDRVPIALVSMVAAAAVVVAGIVPNTSLFSALGGETAILLAATMVIGSALFHTGVAEGLSRAILKVTGPSENGILAVTVVAATIISSICSGTSVVAMMLPIVIGLCMEAKISVSRQMVPLSYAAAFGGNLTLIGAASNIVVNGAMEDLGVPGLGFFEIGKVGIPICIAGIVYFLTIGKKFLTPGDKADPQYLAEYTGKVAAQKAKQVSKTKGVICVIILIVVLIAMVWNNDNFPMWLVAALGAMIMVMTGCITENEAYKAIDMSTILVVVFMSTISNAMTASGAGEMISNAAVGLLGENPNKFLVLLVIYIVTFLLTNIMTNTSTALLMTPLMIPIAVGLDMNTTAVGVCLCVAAASPFLTHVGSGANTLTIKPGNLNFMDFFRPGLGLSIVVMVVAMIFIPIFWPL